MGERKAICCLCHEEKTRLEFPAYLSGYHLGKDGVRICIYCRECEKDFFELDPDQQVACVHYACEQAFPDGQVIYVEKDPRTQEPRYIGRTRNAGRRHAEHIRHTTNELGGFFRREGEEFIEVRCYMRKNWMHDLKQLGLKPIQETLMVVDVAPQVMEWEHRWIFHAIQQRWPILNKEALTSGAERIAASTLDFLHAPFEDLVKAKFILDRGIEAFVQEWYDLEPDEDWMDDKFDAPSFLDLSASGIL